MNHLTPSDLIAARTRPAPAGVSRGRETMWYRGTNSDSEQDYGAWYAASREYAEFFGADISTLDDSDLSILDLRGMGVGNEYPTHLRVQDAADRLICRYDAVRVLQYHEEYGQVEDTLLVF